MDLKRDTTHSYLKYQKTNAVIFKTFDFKLYSLHHINMARGCVVVLTCQSFHLMIFLSLFACWNFYIIITESS